MADTEHEEWLKDELSRKKAAKPAPVERLAGAENEEFRKSIEASRAKAEEEEAEEEAEEDAEQGEDEDASEE